MLTFIVLQPKFRKYWKASNRKNETVKHIRNLNWRNFRNLLKNRKYILPLAFSYFMNYGLVSFCKRIFFTLRTGSLRSSFSIGQQNRLDTLEMIYDLNPKVLLRTNDNRSPSHACRIGNFSQAYWEMSKKTLFSIQVRFLNYPFCLEKLNLSFFGELL